MAYSYRELSVWQKGIALVVKIYQLTESFPKSELYGLSGQMRRAAVSIPANIAEGSARGHRQEYRQFVKIAYASGAELETHLEIGKRLNFISVSDARDTEELLCEIMKMLNALAKSLSKNR